MKPAKAKELTDNEKQRAVLVELATVCPYMLYYELEAARRERAKKWDAVRAKGLAAKLGSGGKNRRMK